MKIKFEFKGYLFSSSYILLVGNVVLNYFLVDIFKSRVYFFIVIRIKLYFLLSLEM